jgi:hypothetical protein
MQKISIFLSAQQSLSSLAQQAATLTALQKIWHATIPENLLPYTQAGNVQHKRLTVYADNGAIAAKIKLLLPTLLSKLQKQGVEVTSIRVQVQVQSIANKPNRSLRVISQNGADNLQALSQQLSGTALGEALARIASHRHQK